MAKQTVVKAALVVLKQTTGGDLYLYQGAPVPDTVDADHRKQLLAEGMLEEVDGPTTVAQSDEGGAPAKSAPKAEWEAYARSQGATDADLDGLTKDDLVAAYGAEG